MGSGGWAGWKKQGEGEINRQRSKQENTPGIVGRECSTQERPKYTRERGKNLSSGKKIQGKKEEEVREEESTKNGRGEKQKEA